MRAALRVRTTVRPGQRIDLAVPELCDGEIVEVVNFPPPAPAVHPSLLEFLDNLPSGPRSYPNWEEIDRRFEAERAAWDGGRSRRPAWSMPTPRRQSTLSWVSAVWCVPRAVRYMVDVTEARKTVDPGKRSLQNRLRRV